MFSSTPYSNDSGSLFQAGVESLQTGRFEQAASCFEKLLALHPDDPQVHSKLGVAYLSLGQEEKAIARFREAIAQDASFLPAYQNLALALCEAHRLEEAQEVCQQGLNVDPAYVPIYLVKAKILNLAGQSEAAEEALQKALEIEPDHPDVRGNLGTLQVLLGRKEEAIENLEKALEAQPLNVSYHRSLASFKKYKGLDDPHIQAMQAALKEPHLQVGMKAGLYFALGKACEDFGDYPAAFANYETGNALVNSTIRFSLPRVEGYFRQICGSFTRGFFDEYKGAGLSDETPVFIVGMPRSGTSLAEQILASHSDVYGAGECHDVFHLFAQELKLLPQNYEAHFAALTEDKITACAQAYLASLRKHDPAAQFITDKMPLNFRYIGFIKTMFPQAKIIHCLRDPRDTCLSIFKQLFVGSLPFAYDQAHIAGYYRLYRDMMAHWHSVFPGEILDFHYEELIGDQKKGTELLLDYCGLTWQESCLDFHKTKRAVTTASAPQVRKPIYKGACGYWKNYEDFLAPEIINL